MDDEAELLRAPQDEVVGPLGHGVVEQRHRHRHVERVVSVQLEDGVGAVLVEAVEAQQLGGAHAVEAEVRAHHDRRAGGARVHAAVDPRVAVEIAREVRDPRQEEVGQRHGLGVLAEAVAGQDGVGVAARQVEQQPAQPVDAFHDSQHALALGGVHADRGEVARAAAEVQSPAHVLPETPDQVLLARVQPAALAAARLHRAVLLHLAERGEDRAPVLRAQETFLHQHHRLRLVEGVERVEVAARAARGQVLQMRQHLLLEADARRAEAAILGRGLLEHGEILPG